LMSCQKRSTSGPPLSFQWVKISFSVYERLRRFANAGLGSKAVPLLNFGWANPIDLQLFQLFAPVELWAVGGAEVC
jgi:hypothetical protein